MNLTTTGDMCKECGCKDFSFIEHLGEKTCDDCGLVLVVNPFEETTQVIALDDDDRRGITVGRLGSYISKHESYGSKERFALYREQLRSQPETESERRARLLINTTLSYYNSGWDIKDRTHAHYKTMCRERIFRGSSVERRCAGLTYFVLKDAGVVCNIQDHAKYTKVSQGDISKMARRIARNQRKAHVFTNDNHIQKANVLLDKMDIEVSQYYRVSVLKMVEYVSRTIDALDMRYSDTMLAATFWWTAKMTGENVTQDNICNVWNSSVIGLRFALQKFADIFGLDRKRLSDMDVEDFVSGVRY
tara:strand:- start:825 stop:1736 length:912 start_codon:yes stop_codon:yes gene_type:complete